MLCVSIGRWHVRYLVQVVRREVRRVRDALERWNEWRINLSNRGPVDTGEEWMLFDLLGTIAAESIFRFADEAVSGNEESASYEKPLHRRDTHFLIISSASWLK